jgi:hypothetical protein
MAKRRGRPPIADHAALHRVAEYIVMAEEKGARCSARAAILRTSAGAPGNSSEAILWRLQRKWRRHGAALLAEAREHQAARRRVARVPVRGGYLDVFVRTLQSGRAAFQPASGRVTELHQNATAALRSLDQFRLAAERQNEAMRAALRLQDQIGRMADFESEVMRARRTFAQLTGIPWA